MFPSNHVVYLFGVFRVKRGEGRGKEGRAKRKKMEYRRWRGEGDEGKMREGRRKREKNEQGRRRRGD